MTPRRVDDNQPEIVNGLRAMGVLVVLTHKQGDGCPDMFVWHPRSKLWFALEIKAPGGRLTLGQRVLQGQWPGAVQVVRNLDEALGAIGVERYSVEGLPLSRRRADATSRRRGGGAGDGEPL